MKVKEALELHDELNPKLWDNEELKEDVYEKLMNIYNEFIKFIDIPLEVVDVEIVGSNASYNYNDKSDIDLHIIVNNEINYMDNDLLQQFYNSKKNSFNSSYDIDIYGIPVEVYIEDVNAGNATNGRYSLLEKMWLLKPEKKSYVIPDISEELNQYVDVCNEALESTDSDYIKSLINDIYMMRKIGLAKDGEASVGNLVFKELRNMNMMDKLREKYYELRSENLSL